MAKHAILSASSAERWLACPPSARLQEQFEDNTSSYAAEGTLAHEMGELIARYNFGIDGLTKRSFNAKMKKLKDDTLYQTEMLNHTENYAAYIHETYNEIKQNAVRDDILILLEARVDFSTFVPDGFGTVDCLIVSDDVLQIIDFKYGKGVEVSAENNKQMMLYALGAYSNYGVLYDCEKISMTIYQPRIDNVSTWTISLNELFRWAESEVKPVAALAFDGAGEYQAGEHCRFCKAKAVCRARAEHNLKLQDYGYINPNILSDDEIADIIRISDNLKNWAEDVAKYALTEALNGKKFNGFKLVEGRSRRTYTDETAIADVLMENDYSESDIYAKKLLSVTAMESLLTRKGFNELLGEYVIKPPGNPVLVPETDKRPEYNPAVVAFADVDISSL